MEYRTEEKGYYYFGTSLHRPWKAIGKVFPEYDDGNNTLMMKHDKFFLEMLGNFVHYRFQVLFCRIKKGK